MTRLLIQKAASLRELSKKTLQIKRNASYVGHAQVFQLLDHGADMNTQGRYLGKAL